MITSNVNLKKELKQKKDFHLNLSFVLHCVGEKIQTQYENFV